MASKEREKREKQVRDARVSKKAAKQVRRLVTHGPRTADNQVKLDVWMRPTAILLVCGEVDGKHWASEGKPRQAYLEIADAMALCRDWAEDKTMHGVSARLLEALGWAAHIFESDPDAPWVPGVWVQPGYILVWPPHKDPRLLHSDGGDPDAPAAVRLVSGWATRMTGPMEPH